MQSKTSHKHPWLTGKLVGYYFVFALTTLNACANIEVDKPQRDNSPLNATYVINNETIMLVNGFAERSATPGSSTKVTTRVWGAPKSADLNGDGQQDAALILIQSPGGSGTFYYVVAAIWREDGYQGTSAVFLGDRIEVQNIDINNNRITVEFLDRTDSDAFSTPPSVPTEQRVLYDPETKQLIQVAREFEGEADPARMKLSMKTWYWVQTSYNDDSVHSPADADVFSLTFQPDGTLLVTTDCNNMRGNYRVEDNRLMFAQMISTRMYCEDSQEQLFAKMLHSVNSYFFTSHGKLVLELKYDSGSMIFQ